MYIVKHALKNVWRNKGRNALIASIIFIIILMTCIGLVIINTSENVIEDYKTEFGAQVNFEPVVTKENITEIPYITTEQQEEISESEYLESYYGTSTDLVVGRSVEALDEDADRLITEISINGGETKDFNPPTMKVVGTTDPANSKASRELVEGEYPEDLNECMVSVEFAEANGLEVGDTFRVQSHSIDPEAENVNYKLTVSGIYQDTAPAYPAMFPWKTAIFNKYNEIVTTYETVRVAYGDAAPPMEEVSYFLVDPSALDAFLVDVENAGVDLEEFNVRTDLEKYTQILEPLEGTQQFVSTILVIALAIGAIILILLTLIATRERKYEIGMLQAIGMTKGKVALSFLIETLVITGLCLVVAIPVGTKVAQPIADVVLQYQNNEYTAENQESTAESAVDNVQEKRGKGEEEVEQMTELKVAMDTRTMVQLIVISLLVAGLACLISVAYISRFEPIKILSDRN